MSNVALNGAHKKYAYYDRVRNEMLNDDTLTSRQKHKLAKMLRYGVLHFEMEQYKKHQEALENERRLQMERENTVYLQYLVNRNNGTNILKDFLTMRY